MRVLWVALGGAVGTTARYLLSSWVLRALGPSFAYGTLVVNLTGSFLIGALMHFELASDVLTPTLRATLFTGVLGGFTTYATFSYDTVGYFEEGAWWLGTVNILATTLGCLTSCALGLLLARWLHVG